MAKTIFFIGLAALLAYAYAEDSYVCDANVVYDWPNTDNCRYYNHCDNGVKTVKSCLILLRKFDPTTLKCNWSWRVDCNASPVTLPPTTTTTTTTSTHPSTRPSTTTKSKPI